jgi:cell wall-associated NlpC family hydrolase
MLKVSEEVPVIESMLVYSMLFVGIPYKYGGNNPLEGFDCSGFVCESLRSIGEISGDYSAQGLFDFLKSKGYRSGLSRGSVLFFGKSQHEITHVAIAISDTLMIEAGGGDRTTLTIEDAIKRNAFVRIRKIRPDLVSAIKIGGVK